MNHLRKYWFKVSVFNLDPIVLSQNSDQVNNIIADSNPLNIDQEYINNSVQSLFEKANEGGSVAVLERFMDIL